MERDGNKLETPLPQQRIVITILLFGGALLVIVGQSLYVIVPKSQSPLALLIIGLGLLSFGAAGYLISGKQVPDQLAKIRDRILSYLDISAAQLMLLLLSPVFALAAALAAGDNWLTLNWPISIFAWLAAVAMVFVGSYQFQLEERPHIDRTDAVILVAFFALAFVSRAIAINSIPTTLSGDEGSAGLMALRFINGEANNLFTVGWFSFPALYFAVQSLGIVLLGQTIAGLRILSVVSGALTVVALYWLVKIIFGRITAILAAGFLATYHYHIHFSRIGLNNIWDGFFAVLALAGVAYGWFRARRLGFLIAGLAVGLGQYFYVTIRIIPLLLLIWAGSAFIVDRATFRKRLPDMILAAGVAVVIALPLIVFFIRHPNEFNAPLQRVTIFGGWLEREANMRGVTPLSVIWGQIATTALGFTHEPLRDLYNPGAPLLLPVAAGFFLLGLLWLLTHPNLGSFLVLLPIAAVILAGGLSVDAPASQRYVIAAPMAAVLVAIPIAETVKWLKRNWPNYQVLIIVGAALVMFGLAANDLRYYFGEIYDSYVLGGVNTQAATELAFFLQGQEPEPDVYFFGFPRMGYNSLSTIPYLVPNIDAKDIEQPLTSAPSWRLTKPTVFIFLPERLSELPYVITAYPGGKLREIRQEDGKPLFIAYEYVPQ